MSVEVAGAGGLHASIILTAVAIVGLKEMTTRRWDSVLGDLAYPVFLVHIPCRAAMSGLLGRTNIWVDVAAVGASIVLSY